MTLYTICHDEGDDFRLWRDDETWIAPLFKTKAQALDYIKKSFGENVRYKSTYIDWDKTTCVEIFRQKEKGFFYRCSIVPCKVVEAST